MNLNANGVVAMLREIMGRVGTSLDAVERSKYVASLLGASIGASLDMPSSPVDIPRNYFLITNGERVACILGAINELYPINIDLATSIADNVFLTRYRLVFEPAFTVHMLGHLATCSDDAVPTDISDLMKKVSTESEDLGSLGRVLCDSVQRMGELG